MTPEAPKRQYEMELRLGADSMDDLVRLLKHIQFVLSGRTGPQSMFSGGYDSSYSLSIEHNPEITNESYRAALDEWLVELERKDAAAQDGGGE